MAAEDFDVDIDLQTNALLNACLQVLSSDPTGKAGRTYINSTDDPQTLRFYDADASVWRKAGIEYTAGDALTLTGNDFDVNVAAGAGGIEISSDALRISTGAAGNGLTGGGGSALAVNTGTGLEISSDAVRIASGAAGAGLTGGGGSALAVGAGTGITVNADDVAVNTSVIATVAALDAVREGIQAKNARVAVLGNQNIANPGTSSFGGETLSNGDTVLLAGQTTASQNGKYIFNGSGSAMTRSPDMNSWDEFVGTRVLITEGTYKGIAYNSDAEAGGTLGSTNVAFVAAPDLSALVAGIGITKTGNTIDFDGDFGGTFLLDFDGGLTLLGDSASSPFFALSGADFLTFDGAPLTDVGNGTADTDAATLGQSGRGYKTTVGDGTNTSIVVTHNLGTRDVIVEVYVPSGSYETRGCRVERTTTNTVTLIFNTAPASNSRRVLIRSV